MHSSKVELDVFAASTFMLVGNGESNLLWEDRLMDWKSIRHHSAGGLCAHPEVLWAEARGSAGWWSAAGSQI
jgi:hypothetical protein